MSLCFKLKLIWKEVTSSSLRKTKSSTQCVQQNHQSITDGRESVEHQESPLGEQESSTNGQEINGNYYEAHGVMFASRQDRDSFILKMKTMRQAFEKEILEITRQHQRLRAGGYLLNSRVLEMERIIRTDQRKRSIGSIKAANYDSSCLNSEDFRVVQEIDNLYNTLDNAHEEIISLKRYLDIEYKERTLYPEPVLLRSSNIEDEFSKKMKLEGGLKYQSKDNTIKHITYHCLPPPFSLHQISTQ